jgi:hypothetical protein
MNKKIAKLWLKALRSSKYKQGRESLRFVDDDHKVFCCLGVLCDIKLSQENKSEAAKNRWFGNNTDYLPMSVRKWAGMNTGDGVFNENSSLVVLNDEQNKSFKYIANVIEKKQESL